MTEGSRWSKCVVFSQFGAVLDVAAEELGRAGIRFVRVEGCRKGYQRDQRADAVLDFSADPGVRVLMLSMRAGAAGLNLIAADHCFIMDAVINSVVEERAINWYVLCVVAYSYSDDLISRLSHSPCLR